MDEHNSFVTFSEVHVVGVIDALKTYFNQWWPGYSTMKLQQRTFFYNNTVGTM
jgi:hypothetical protein